MNVSAGTCSMGNVLLSTVNKCGRQPGLKVASTGNVVGKTVQQSPGESIAQNVRVDEINKYMSEENCCIFIDLKLCHATFDGETSGKSHEDYQHKTISLSYSILGNLAMDLSKTPKCEPGLMAIVSAVAGYRSTDSHFFRDSLDCHWEVTSDDQYILCGLVPGELSEAVHSVQCITKRIGQIKPADRTSGDLSDIVIRSKTRLLSCTEPTSCCCREHVTMQQYFQLGNLYYDLLELSDQLLKGDKIMFTTIDKRTVLKAVKEDDENVLWSTQCSDKGFTGDIIMALGNKMKTGTGGRRDVIAELQDKGVASLINSETREEHFASWKVAMMVAMAAESYPVDEGLAKNILKYSRIPNDAGMDAVWEIFLGIVSLQPLQNLLKSANMSITATKWHVQMGGDTYDILAADHKNASGSDHDNKGILGVQKFQRVPKRVAGLLIAGGRGSPSTDVEQEMIYRAQGKRYRLTVVDGVIVCDKRADLYEDINPARNIESLKIGTQGGEIIKDKKGLDCRVLSSGIINTLLNGKHGERVARWIWAMMLCGEVQVTGNSKSSKSFLNFEEVVTGDDGINVYGNLCPSALKASLTYSDGTNVYLDVSNNGKLRKVLQKSGNFMLIDDSELDGFQHDGLQECTILSKRLIG